MEKHIAVYLRVSSKSQDTPARSWVDGWHESTRGRR